MQFTEDEMNFLRQQHPLAWSQVNVLRLERENKQLLADKAELQTKISETIEK